MPRPPAKILTLPCEVCGDSFETQDTKRGRKRVTCSKSCASKKAYENQKAKAPCLVCGELAETAKSVVNAELPVYHTGCRKRRFLNECKVCAKQFRSDRASTVYCTTKCERKGVADKTIELECTCCGELFVRPRFTVANKQRVYCTRKCAQRQFSKENPTRYGGTWTTWIRRIKARDNNTCILCGETEKLQVHHFKKMLTFSDPNEAHFYENLGLFCVTCHDIVEDSGLLSLSDFYERYSPTP